MKQYLDASPRVRQWFFFIAVVWLGLVLLTVRFNTYFPLSGNAQEQLAQIDARATYALVALVLFYLGLSVQAVLLAAKAVRTKQWPPAGVAVPFRTQIHEIRRPLKVWFWVSVLVCAYGTHIALAGVQAVATHSMLQEALRLVAPKP